MPLKILVADDHPLMMLGVCRALEVVDDFELVATATRGSQVLPLVSRHRPDVALLDIRMPQLDGLGCLDRIVERFPETKVIMLSVFEDPEHVQAAFARGAAGYVVKSINPIDLPAAIRQLIEGTVSGVIGPQAPSTLESLGLTKREGCILDAVARGLSNGAIAKELWVTEQTVKFHLTNIYRKLGVANRTQAARVAYERGVVRAA